MTDIDQILRELSEAAREESPPPIDVRLSILETLRTRSQPACIDLTPIAFAGVSVAVAATVVFAFLPTWQSLSGPWVGLLQ